MRHLARNTVPACTTSGWTGPAVTAAHLDLPSRILAVADVAEALSSERPYRGALGPDEVLAIIRRAAGVALDATAFEALEAMLPDWTPPVIGPSWAPGPMPARAGA